MAENAELWSRLDKESQEITLKSWLRTHNIPYNEDDSIEELRQLYIDVETGNYATLA